MRRQLSSHFLLKAFSRDPSPDLATWAFLIALSRQSPPASVKAFTALSPCHPLGQSGSARPPCLTTSGGDSETPSQRLHQPNRPRSALPPLPPLPLPLLPPPPPSPPPLPSLQAPTP